MCGKLVKFRQRRIIIYKFNIIIFNSINKPLTPEVMKQTALILVVAVSISILSFLLGKVIYNKYPQKKKSILQYCTLATIPVLMLFL